MRKQGLGERIIKNDKIKQTKVGNNSHISRNFSCSNLNSLVSMINDKNQAVSHSKEILTKENQMKASRRKSLSSQNILIHKKSLTSKQPFDISMFNSNLLSGKPLNPSSIDAIEFSPPKHRAESKKASKRDMFGSLVSGSIKSLSQKKTNLLNFSTKKTFIEEIKKPFDILRKKSVLQGKIKAKEGLLGNNFMESIKNVISNLSQKEEARDLFKRDYAVSPFN